MFRRFTALALFCATVLFLSPSLRSAQGGIVMGLSLLSLISEIEGIDCVIAKDPYCMTLNRATGEELSALVRKIKKDDPTYFKGRYYGDNGRKARLLVLTRAAELYYTKHPEAACPEGIKPDDFFGRLPGALQGQLSQYLQGSGSAPTGDPIARELSTLLGHEPSPIAALDNPLISSALRRNMVGNIGYDYGRRLDRRDDYSRRSRGALASRGDLGGTKEIKADCSAFVRRLLVDEYGYTEGELGASESLIRPPPGTQVRGGLSAAKPGDIVGWPGHVGVYVGRFQVGDQWEHVYLDSSSDYDNVIYPKDDGGWARARNGGRTLAGVNFRWIRDSRVSGMVVNRIPKKGSQ